MAITFNLELNSRPNKKGQFAIFIRITENKKIRKVKSSVSVSRKSDWNKDKQKVRTSDPEARKLNAILEQEMERAKQACRTLSENGVSSADSVQKKLKGENETTLLAYSKKVHASMYQEGRLGNWKKYGSFVQKLEGYLTDCRGNVHDISFSEVTPSFVSAFTSWLQSLENTRYKDSADGMVRLNPNTIIKLQRILRAIVNKAEREGMIKADANPFRVYQVSSERPTIKNKLTEEELGKIESLELEEGSLAWHARNAFFLSYYCAGIRASDMIQLKWANILPEGRLFYQMGKNHKPKDILLVHQAQQILRCYYSDDVKPSDYIFPYLNSGAKYAKYITQAEKDTMPLEQKKVLFDTINAREVQINKQLNKIASLAGVDKHVSFHISRHTFARSAKQAGTDNAVLEGLMNHSSLAVTERYMREFDTSKEDKALAMIFQSKQDPKDDAQRILESMTPEVRAEILKLLQ